MTWVIWRYNWRFQEGEYRFEVRTYDGEGVLQSLDSRGTRPDGATGVHGKKANMPTLADLENPPDAGSGVLKQPIASDGCLFGDDIWVRLLDISLRHKEARNCMDWLQIGAFGVAVLGLGLAGLVYVTRLINRMADNIDTRLTRLEERMGAVEQWQARVDERFLRIDERFQRIDERFLRIDERFDRLDARFDRMDARLDNSDESLDEGLRAVRGDLQSLGIEQARMLGFLEGRGVMGKAPPERVAETES